MGEQAPEKDGAEIEADIAAGRVERFDSMPEAIEGLREQAEPMAVYILKDDGTVGGLTFLDENDKRIWSAIRMAEVANARRTQPLDPSVQKLCDELKEMRLSLRVGEHVYLFAEPPLHTSSKEADGCEGLREALTECAQLTWDGCDIDGGDFHNLMVKLGLFVEVPADKEYKEEWDLDKMFVLAWSPEALAAQEQK